MIYLPPSIYALIRRVDEALEDYMVTVNETLPMPHDGSTQSQQSGEEGGQRLLAVLHAQEEFVAHLRCTPSDGVDMADPVSWICSTMRHLYTSGQLCCQGDDV